jgi:Tfp pilus assembly protein PilF
MDTSKLSVEELVELGKLRMKQKDYQEAKRTLYDAYNRFEPRLVDLLDYLMFVSLKLGDEDVAMYYVAEMIRTYPTSALVGYSRSRYGDGRLIIPGLSSLCSTSKTSG